MPVYGPIYSVYGKPSWTAASLVAPSSTGAPLASYVRFSRHIMEHTAETYKAMLSLPRLLGLSHGPMRYARKKQNGLRRFKFARCRVLRRRAGFQACQRLSARLRGQLDARRGGWCAPACSIRRLRLFRSQLLWTMARQTPAAIFARCSAVNCRPTFARRSALRTGGGRDLLSKAVPFLAFASGAFAFFRARCCTFLGNYREIKRENRNGHGELFEQVSYFRTSELPPIFQDRWSVWRNLRISALLNERFHY